MSFLGKTIGKVVGGITGATEAAKGAQNAADTQAAAAQTGIEEQRRQFDIARQLLNPFVTAGSDALGAQQDLLGLGAPGAQQSAIAALEGSPQFAALQRQGEEGILSNASATGGLRGGNVQGALAQFRPQLLAQLIEQQYGRLGGIAGMGQASAAGVGSAGMQTGSNIAQLLQQKGAATAGGQIAASGVQRQAFGDALKIGGTIAGFF